MANSKSFIKPGRFKEGPKRRVSMRGRRGGNIFSNAGVTGKFGGKQYMQQALQKGFVTLQTGQIIATPQFVKKMQKAENSVLFKTGRYAMRVYKSTLRRKPPMKYTKASVRAAGKTFDRTAMKGGSIEEARSASKRRLRFTKRYREENYIRGKQKNPKTRAPYNRSGKLRNQCAFKVDGHNVYAGPPLDKGLSAYQVTFSNQKIPGLLDKGGPAKIVKWIRYGDNNDKRKKVVRNVTFRPHPYVKNVWDKTMPKMRKEMMNMLHK